MNLDVARIENTVLRRASIVLLFPLVMILWVILGNIIAALVRMLGFFLEMTLLKWPKTIWKGIVEIGQMGLDLFWIAVEKW